MRTLDPQSLSQHIDRLYRAAWALCGSREDAEDLVQETFARVLSRTRVLHGDDELYYLMRVLRNTFLTSRRTASRRPVTVATLEDVAVADPQPMGQPERALEMQEVYATIADLPEDFRLALVAVDVLGLSYREASRALRVREATITTRLFRARKQVAGRLAVDSDPGAASPVTGPPDATPAPPKATARTAGPGGAALPEPPADPRGTLADKRASLCFSHAPAPLTPAISSSQREGIGPTRSLPQ
jgi:RNA polymerase sigma-70 factor, ECF subfamily